MKGYFIIFPHAGAIRSGYYDVERCVNDKYDVIFIDYNRIIEYENDFYSLTEVTWRYLTKTIIRKNAELILFGHSMGSCVLQALEMRLSDNYYVSHIVHSDGDVLVEVIETGLQNKNKNEQKQILKEQYDIPSELRFNDDLLNYFEEYLLRDLLILDNIPSYLQKYGVPCGAAGEQHLIFISDVYDFKKASMSWKRAYSFLNDNNFYAIIGDHYKVLADFEPVYKRILQCC